MKRKINFRLFISYSNKDKELIVRLADDLISNGIDVLYDENLVKKGGKWQEQLTSALVDADGILVFITPNSISSQYVMNELGMARAQTRNSKGGKLLLPLIYGDVKIPEFIQDIQAIYWQENYQEVVSHITKAVNKFIEGVHEADSNKKNESEKEIEVSQDIDRPNYWFLKLNPETWNIEKLKVGTNTFFSPYYLNKKRPEFSLFNKVKTGDQVLGFASGNYQSIVCLMQVTDPVGPDKKWGEVFRMTVKRLISPRIFLKSFKDIIPNILPKLEQSTIPPELFYSLPEKTFNSILEFRDELDKGHENSYQPFFLTEGNHQATDDKLDFENDIDSFASVISLERVEPPLAIGLFGNWGSGKSFFMEKLSERIEENSELKEAEYVKNVVQVKFNSWHYSDANLWASLITQIFESLHDYATKKKFGSDAIRAIYKDLNITGHQLKETQKKIDANAVQENVLKEQKIHVEETIRQKKESLSMWTAKDLVNMVFSDPYIQQDFENIKAQFDDENLIDNIKQVDEKITQVDTVLKQIVESFGLLKKNHKGKWIWLWIITVIFAVCVWLVLGPFKLRIQEFISGGVVVSGLFIGWLTNAVAKISPYFKKINQFYRRIKSLKKTIDTEKEKVKLKEHDEVDCLNKDIRDLTKEKAMLELQQTETAEKKAKLENEINEIGSGKLLANFLADKSMDDAYIKQLGIISWIRKDFSKLNDLFQEQKTVQSIEEGAEAKVKIDRIVLYIDDLDRCNVEVVVKVLEAIHLLLAFPLFVVVVGVDPRWLNNALSEKYKNLFGDGSEEDRKKEQRQTDDVDLLNKDNLFYPEYATSFDYLEKIFQIPFALKPINKVGREKLIQYLIRDEMEISSNSTISKTNTSQTSEITGDNLKSLSEDKKDEDKPNISTDEESLNTSKRAKDKLVFTSSERSYLQKISALYGKTPRSINRYINIYRIIKAHGSLKIKGDFSSDEFKPIMFILGVIVGYSFLARQFIEEIAEAKDDQKYENFLNSSGLNDKIKTLLKPLSTDLKDVLMVDFKRNLELISRFSFRTII